MRPFLHWLLILAFSGPFLMAQPTQEELGYWSLDYLPPALNELKEFLALPNNAKFPDHIQKNLDWLETSFRKRDFKTRTIPTQSSPLLLAQRNASKPSKTVLFYMHFDGQPVDPSQWNQDSPYNPVVKKRNELGTWEKVTWEIGNENWDPELRIFARSASDDKSPIIALLAAIDILDREKIEIPFNIKVILDSEEEIGSPNLAESVNKHKDDLAADFLVIMDGPRHISNKPTLTFGARGIIGLEIKVFGPAQPLHSGHYGNYSPNPALRMAQLLGSMKDDKGRVLLPGFYQGIELDSNVQKMLAQVPDDEAFIQQKIGIAEADKVGQTYQEALQYPSLNIRGMSSGWVGAQARTIIPDHAVANLDIRLVPESDPEALIKLVIDHIKERGYHLVETEPTPQERKDYPKLARVNYRISYQAFRTEMESEIGRWLGRALIRSFGQPPIKIRIGGGSIPISPFIRALNTPAVIVPLVNSDNNQHSPNENLRLGNFKEGIQTCLAILTQALP